LTPDEALVFLKLLKLSRDPQITRNFICQEGTEARTKASSFVESETDS